MVRSRIYAWAVIAAAAAVIAATVGCDATGGTARLGRRGPTRAASRMFRDTNLDTVQPVAERVFRQHFRVDPGASTESMLVSHPKELSGSDHPERLRDVLRPSPNRRRQTAELQVVQEGPNVLVRCVVETQRLDTAERAAFAQARGDDRPTDTPIDRQGALSSDPREEWVTVGRDKGLEQEILTAIQRELALASGPAA